MAVVHGADATPRSCRSLRSRRCATSVASRRLRRRPVRDRRPFWRIPGGVIGGVGEDRWHAGERELGHVLGRRSRVVQGAVLLDVPRQVAPHEQRGAAREERPGERSPVQAGHERVLRSGDELVACLRGQRRRRLERGAERRARVGLVSGGEVRDGRADAGRVARGGDASQHGDAERGPELATRVVHRRPRARPPRRYGGHDRGGHRRHRQRDAGDEEEDAEQHVGV